LDLFGEPFNVHKQVVTPSDRRHEWVSI